MYGFAINNQVSVCVSEKERFAFSPPKPGVHLIMGKLHVFRLEANFGQEQAHTEREKEHQLASKILDLR